MRLFGISYLASAKAGVEIFELFMEAEDLSRIKSPPPPPAAPAGEELIPLKSSAYTHRIRAVYSTRTLRHFNNLRHAIMHSRG